MIRLRDSYAHVITALRERRLDAYTDPGIHSDRPLIVIRLPLCRCVITATGTERLSDDPSEPSGFRIAMFEIGDEAPLGTGALVPQPFSRTVTHPDSPHGSPTRSRSATTPRPKTTI
jgi:hypothetical protein